MVHDVVSVSFTRPFLSLRRLDSEVSTRAFETRWMMQRALFMRCPCLEVASAMKGAAKPPPPPGVFSTGYMVIKHEGYRGLYKGLSASLMRQVRPTQVDFGIRATL